MSVENPLERNEDENIEESEGQLHSLPEKPLPPGKEQDKKRLEKGKKAFEKIKDWLGGQGDEKEKEEDKEE